MGRFFSWVWWAMGQGQKNMMGQDGSTFTGQSLASYKEEAQEHGVSILYPFQWVSKKLKNSAKILKNGHYMPSTHVILSHH